MQRRWLVVLALLFSLSVVSRADEETPVTLDPLAAQKNISGARDWVPSETKDQMTALGWTPEAFAIPKGLESRVQFWIDIYTRYSTAQGVVHDSENVDLIYEVLDFRDIERLNLPLSFREKLKRKMVDEAKERAKITLRKVSEAKNPQDLSPWERRVWAYLAADKNPQKYENAMSPSRLRFQLGQSDRMESAIYLSGRYREDFEKIFREQNLPVELTRLVFVESSFNVLARSKVGASGLWQIMPSVARPYRVMGAAVDGRNNPLVATKMAAKLLAANYQMLGSWPLAVTGYNHGAAGVRKIVDRYQTKNLSDLIDNVRSRASFGFASRNFYASFLAALEVERKTAKYFPNISWSKKLDADDLALPKAIKYGDLLTWFAYDEQKLQIYNPHLTWRTKKGYGIPAGTHIFLPAGKTGHVLAALGKHGQTRTIAEMEENLQVHKVSRGENLTTIAKAYGVKLRELLLENGIGLEEALRPGQRIKIPR